MAVAARSTPVSSHFCPQSRWGSGTGEPGIVARTQPTLPTTSSCEASGSGQVLNSFGSLTPL